MLSQNDQKFIQKRKSLIKFWPVFGLGLLLIWAGLFALLVLQSPYLIHPLLVQAHMNSGMISPNTQFLLIYFCPIMGSLVIFLIFVIILFLMASGYNETKWLKIVERISGPEEKPS